MAPKNEVLLEGWRPYLGFMNFPWTPLSLCFNSWTFIQGKKKTRSASVVQFHQMLGRQSGGSDILFCPKKNEIPNTEPGVGEAFNSAVPIPAWNELASRRDHPSPSVFSHQEVAVPCVSAELPCSAAAPPLPSTERKPRSAGPSAPLRKKHLFPAFNQTKVLASFIGKVSNEKQEIKQFNNFSLSSKVCRCPHVIKKKNLNSMDPTSVTTSCWDRWQQTDGG